MKNFLAKKTAALFLLTTLVFCPTACELSGDDARTDGKNETLAIMTWNLQALFDGEESGNEYEEYRAQAGWSQEKYAGRLNVIAQAIGAMERTPDVIAFQEVESAGVLQSLAAALKAQGYGWTHFSNLPGMSLGVGLLSRFPISGAKAHSVTVNGDIAPRPMLEARINSGGGSENGGEAQSDGIALFVCHWKSKLGGDDVTEATRRASARIILRRIRELQESEPELPVIIMGDLNENHDEFYRRRGNAICALLPDDPRSAELAAANGGGLQKDFIVLSKNMPPAARYFPQHITALYSPWSAGLSNGTYYYKNAWETIDHFLLSAPLFDGTGWEFEKCAVVDSPPFANAGGYPVVYNPRTGSGLSDHLPLLLTLKKMK